jgi:hypothetical protein
MLTRVAQDAERALRAVEQAAGLLADEAVVEAHRLLRELVGQDFDVDDEGVPRLHRGTQPGRIISTVDPEMRHGRKSESQRFDGFKLHAAVTNSEQPLITAVTVGDASAHDGAEAKTLIDQQPAESRPERILGDCAYGDQRTREEMEQRGVRVLARVPEGEVREGRIGKREFQIDLDAGTVTCPGGHTIAIPKRARRGGERVVNFGTQRCNDCPLKPRCAPYPGGRKLTIAPRETCSSQGGQPSRTPRPKNTCDAHAPGSNGSSGCSPTATAPARTATSAAPKASYKPPGPPPWSTSTPSATASTPNRPEQALSDPVTPNMAHPTPASPIPPDQHPRQHTRPPRPDPATPRNANTTSSVVF